MIRRRTEADLRRAGLPREKVLAAVVRLLEKTLIRVGNDRIRAHEQVVRPDDHARRARQGFGLEGPVHFPRQERDRSRARSSTIGAWRGSSSSAAILPGQELFQYRDQDDRIIDVSSDDVNAYLKEIAGEDFTSKDFRTWAGTVLAADAAARAGRRHASADEENRRRVVEEVARAAGQHEGGLPKVLHPPGRHRCVSRWGSMGRRAAARAARAVGKLTPTEAAVLALLQRRVAQKAGCERSSSGQRDPAVGALDIDARAAAVESSLEPAPVVFAAGLDRQIVRR